MGFCGLTSASFTFGSVYASFYSLSSWAAGGLVGAIAYVSTDGLIDSDFSILFSSYIYSGFISVFSSLVY